MIQIYRQPRECASRLPLVIGIFEGEEIKIDAPIDGEIAELMKKGYLPAKQGNCTKSTLLEKSPTKSSTLSAWGNARNTAARKSRRDAGKSLLSWARIC